MPSHYSRLPNASGDADRELEDAFESENEDDGHTHSEQTPLTTINVNVNVVIPGAYNFERDYDYPPPGSPPGLSAFALPNDFGNTNGHIPASPPGETPSAPRPSFFRRLAGAVLPTHYVRVPAQPAPSVRGGGMENDGVFANVMAKPGRQRVVRAQDGNVHMVPEDIQKEPPPSYNEAQADAVPPYWETTVHAPAGPESGSDMIIDDLPSGSVWIFFVNIFISFFFQIIGFILTHLLHTSHAAKFGSRVGLGFTLIQYGFYYRSMESDDATGGDQTDAITWPPVETPDVTDASTAVTNPDDVQVVSSLSMKDWISFILMTAGWFLVLSSAVGFWRVKRWETSIRSTTTPERPQVTTREEVERDIAVRRNLETVFGVSFDDDATHRPNPRMAHMDENGHVIVIPAAEALEEARLARDLRAAGLL
ncbi:uncharacterized protein BT62DRAFT_926292 [Guyanagaster necrorhizus]|uniref:Metal homeostatis protein bsd2 n=1 Tax=Guyanagaster necrorhizus TaxID=856835 RepID=A0A9P7W3W6_9AGAR|nr:uncharacterized protein BT62DRAFT_926292 [Guyanagaster necrorhizus MCA 3950]KAG7452079.1 hypothetical protein BT62DRAFT_926292 [Guyanagaster necrorhizus MCA 3950]